MNKTPYTHIPRSAIYIDMKYTQFLQGIMGFLNQSDRKEMMFQLSQIFIGNPTTERLLVTISVRTCLDLALQCCEYQPGSEIIVTAINIPDMITILRYHGLKVVPVEIEPSRLSPTLEDFKQAYKPGVTKAIMVSYLYGAKYDATEIFKWAKENQLLVLEDEAESFSGTQKNGHELADISFFSFGSMKPNTAFGGALNVIRNNEALYRKMKARLEQYPLLPKSKYFQKMLKNSVLMFLLNNTIHYKTGYFLLEKLWGDDKFKTFILQKLKGFAPTSTKFLETFRYQIPNPMLYMLSLRMTTFDAEKFISENNKVRNVQDQLVDNGIQVPGSGDKERNFWLFPIITPNPILTQKVLISRGISGAYLGATQLAVTDTPLGDYKQMENTRKYFNNLVYLPVHRQVSQKDLDIIIKEAINSVKIVKNITSRKQAEYPKL